MWLLKSKHNCIQIELCGAIVKPEVTEAIPVFISQEDSGTVYYSGEFSTKLKETDLSHIDADSYFFPFKTVLAYDNSYVTYSPEKETIVFDNFYVFVGIKWHGNAVTAYTVIFSATNDMPNDILQQSFELLERC